VIMDCQNSMIKIREQYSLGVNEEDLKGVHNLNTEIIQLLTGWDLDCVFFKIMSKLACTNDYCVTNFLHLRIKSLGPCEDLQNEVH
jgi:hypothetical protein